jgi:hypothetical protein
VPQELSPEIAARLEKNVKSFRARRANKVTAAKKTEGSATSQGDRNTRPSDVKKGGADDD